MRIQVFLFIFNNYFIFFSLFLVVHEHKTTCVSGKSYIKIKSMTELINCYVSEETTHDDFNFIELWISSKFWSNCTRSRNFTRRVSRRVPFSLWRCAFYPILSDLVKHDFKHVILVNVKINLKYDVVWSTNIVIVKIVIVKKKLI